MTKRTKLMSQQPGSSGNHSSNKIVSEHHHVLDLAALMAELFDKLANAQLSLIQARLLGERRSADEAMLLLRATALLLASIPAPDQDARRYATLAASVLASEDQDSASHARRMIELAIRLDDERLSGPFSYDE